MTHHYAVVISRLIQTFNVFHPPAFTNTNVLYSVCLGKICHFLYDPHSTVVELLHIMFTNFSIHLGTFVAARFSMTFNICVKTFLGISSITQFFKLQRRSRHRPQFVYIGESKYLAGLSRKLHGACDTLMTVEMKDLQIKLLTRLK